MEGEDKDVSAQARQIERALTPSAAPAAPQMDEWTLNQILASTETQAIMYAALGKAYFEHLKNGKRFTDLPEDLLAIVFSFLDRRDILSFICINSACLHAMHKPQAWKRHAHQRLSELLPKEYEQFRNLLHLFDPF